MHVLYLTMGAGIGGGSISLQSLMGELRKWNVGSSVVLPEDGPLVERYERLGVPCYVMNYDWLSRRNPVKTLAGFRRWHALLRRLAPDLIHVNALPAARAVAPAAWSLRIPWVCHCRFPPEPAYASWFLRGLPKPRAVLFCSHGLHRESGPDLSAAWPRSQQYVVHDGIDAERFRVVDRRPHRPPRVGIVANLIPVKAHEVFVDMAAQLSGEGIDAEYWLVGRDKGSEATIRARIARCNLDAQVKLLGYQEDIPAVLAELDVVVCCSHQEPFGLCVAEAMAAGLPVVATRVGGLPEVVEEGVTGLLVPPHDPAALAGAVRRLLRDEALRERMGASGVRRAAALFNSAATARKILSIYARFSAAAGRVVAASAASNDAPSDAEPAVSS